MGAAMLLSRMMNGDLGCNVGHSFYYICAVVFFRKEFNLNPTLDPITIYVEPSLINLTYFTLTTQLHALLSVFRDFFFFLLKQFYFHSGRISN